MVVARKNIVPPVMVEAKYAPCQEVVHRVGTLDLDLRKLLPAPSSTSNDAGPFFCLGPASDRRKYSDMDGTIVHLHRAGGEARRYNGLAQA